MTQYSSRIIKSPHNVYSFRYGFAANSFLSTISYSKPVSEIKCLFADAEVCFLVIATVEVSVILLSIFTHTPARSPMHECLQENDNRQLWLYRLI